MISYIRHVLPDLTRIARALALVLICVTTVAGVVLMAQGAMQGVALVLSAGLLGAAYAQWVLAWRPGADEAQSSRRPEPAPEEVEADSGKVSAVQSPARACESPPVAAGDGRESRRAPLE